MKHLFVKIFGGTYTSKSGWQYSYTGSLRSWFETKWYNFRKKRLLKKVDRFQKRYTAHMVKGRALRIECERLTKEMEDFK